MPSPGTAPWFRTQFTLPSGSLGESALLYVASVGFCDVSVNGEPASTAVLSPSVSYLPSRVMYRVYNVSDLLLPGRDNVIGLWASPGWAEYMSFDWASGTQWEKAPAVMAELHVGNTVLAATGNKGWSCRASTIQRLGDWGKGGFGGDAVNDNLAVDGWDTPDAVLDPTWVAPALLAVASNITVSADIMEPTVRQDVVPSISMRTIVPASATHGSTVLVTMAELYTGWLSVEGMTGAPNSTVQFHISTTTGTQTEFNMADSFTFGPSGKGRFENRFSYHEIHFITIVGLQSTASITVSGRKLYSNFTRHGTFECSSALLTQIYDTTITNYLGLTTGGMSVDCPHRERRGYGGDSHTSYQVGHACTLVCFSSQSLPGFASRACPRVSCIAGSRISLVPPIKHRCTVASVTHYCKYTSLRSRTLVSGLTLPNGRATLPTCNNQAGMCHTRRRQ